MANNLKKILIREEVESWELSSLGFQELVQVLLDNFELPVEVKEKRKEVLDDQSSQAIAFLVDPFHLSLEDLVISLEN